MPSVPPMPHLRPIEQGQSSPDPCAPRGAIWIAHDQLAPQGGPRQSFDLDLAPGCSQRLQRGGSDDLGVVTIGHDHSAAIGTEIRTVKRGAVKARWQTPVEPVAMFEVIAPLAVAEQVTAGDLDLDDHDLPFAIDPHQVGTPTAAQRHLGETPDFIAGKQPGNPARHQRGIGRHVLRSGRGHRPRMEHSANKVKPGTAARAIRRCVDPLRLSAPMP